MSVLDEIAIVEDDETLRDAYEDLLRSHGYRARLFETAEDFLVAATLPIDCVILDIKLPGIGGLELLTWIRKNMPDLPVLIVSSHDDETTRRRVKSSGAMAFLGKPFDPEELIKLIKSI